MRKVIGALVVLNLVVLGLVGATTAALRQRAQEREALACRDFVQTRVRQLDLKPEERRWEEIGWLHDVDEAIRLSRKHHRPLLVYCLDGHLDGRS
ncbi:MAG: hypothetical protein EB084_05490 [Proteobacteria bacterium]|nr:hypothetical protein [Pseudomonadota bacterium]